MKLIKAILVLLSIFFTGCEKETTWKIKSDNKDILVVDGILVNDRTSQSIRLSYTIQELNAPLRPYSNAIVEISDSTRTFQFAEDNNNPGNYLSEPFRAVVGRKYYLTITTDSVIYTASAFAVAVSPLKDIQIIKEDSGDLYNYVHVEDMKPSMTELFYDWSSDTEYCKAFGYCQASETYYSLNNVDVNKAFGPEKQKIKFPKGTIIIRKKYSLNEEHQEFLRSLLIETEWRGGLFDVQQGNVETNLTNEALGYFAVCMVVSDTTIVK